MFFQDIGLVLWLSVPLVLSNVMPVLIGGMGPSIDGGRLWRDGRPIFGPSKTWSGLAGGIIIACLWTFLMLGFTLVIDLWVLFEAWGSPITSAILHVICLAVGVHLGDLTKSFFKRRRGKTNGSAWPFFDQFDAVIGGFGLAALVDWQWFAAELIPGRWEAVIALCGVYFLGHRALSMLSHRIGWKSTAC